MLEKNRKRIQGLVARGVVLKYTPRLRFVLDESVERGNRVLKILEELEAPPASFMKSHPKIIDRILEKIRESQTICVGGPYPARRRLHRLATGPGAGLAPARQGGGLLERRPAAAKIRLPRPRPSGAKAQRRRPEFDLVIALDCASLERLGAIGPAVRQPQVAHQY